MTKCNYNLKRKHKQYILYESEIKFDNKIILCTNSTYNICSMVFFVKKKHLIRCDKLFLKFKILFIMQYYRGCVKISTTLYAIIIL